MNKIFSEKYVASISILWAVSMTCLVILKRSTLDTLGLNEIGDALAGGFAPLGFFWLVAGFYQQGKGLEQNSIALNLQAKELQASTDALKLQVEEMKASVEQQKIMAEFQRLENEEKHNSLQPFLEVSTGITAISEGRYYFSFNIQNITANDARNIIIETDVKNCVNQAPKNYSVLLKGADTSFNEIFSTNEVLMYCQNSTFERVIHLKYESILGRVYEQEYLLEVGRSIDVTHRKITKIR